MASNTMFARRNEICALVLLIAAPLAPALTQPVATCEKGPNEGRIVACTELLRQEQSPENAVAIHKNRGQAYKWSNQNELAVKDFDVVLAANPADVEALYGRAAALNNLKLPERALADADRLIAMGRPAAVYAVQQLRCRALAALGRFDEAIQACTDQLRPFAGPAFLVDRGEVYLMARQYDRAIEDFEAALGVETRTAHARLGRGKAMFAKGNYAAALKDFDEANRIIETMSGEAWPMALSKRGLANEALGHRGAAIADFQKALKIWPHLEESRDGLKRLAADPTR
jgi:tetratricopeptide (TPR) repeat protein